MPKYILAPHKKRIHIELKCKFVTINNSGGWDTLFVKAFLVCV